MKHPNIPDLSREYPEIGNNNFQPSLIFCCFFTHLKTIALYIFFNIIIMMHICQGR